MLLYFKSAVSLLKPNLYQQDMKAPTAEQTEEEQRLQKTEGTPATNNKLMEQAHHDISHVGQLFLGWGGDNPE